MEHQKHLVDNLKGFTYATMPNVRPFLTKIGHLGLFIYLFYLNVMIIPFRLLWIYFDHGKNKIHSFLRFP